MRSPDAIQRLLLGVRRQHPEDHGQALADRHLLDAPRRLARDIFEMRRIPAHHAPQADDRLEPLGLRQHLRRDRQLKSAGNATDLDAALIDPDLLQPAKTSGEELFDDVRVEPGRHNRDSRIFRHIPRYECWRFGAHEHRLRRIPGKESRGGQSHALPSCEWIGYAVFVTGLLSKRLFPLLQLTRMALVFTAISNSLCTLMLLTRQRIGRHGIVLEHLSWKQALGLAIISTGLYGYGMSLNDIIDRRRDATLAANRPLPSGRISVTTAHLICALLALVAVAAGAVYARLSHQGSTVLVMLIGTAMLITFYDVAGKYLVALGLVTLGLIRFFHAIIPAPEVPLLWHPLLLMNHTTVLSLVAYRWEQKRPRLTRLHWWGVLGMLALIDLVLVGLEIGDIVWRGGSPPGSIIRALGLRRALAAPALAAIAFIVLAWRIRRRRERRIAGQMLMLYGLLWLIIYDVSFAVGYVDLMSAGVLLMLLPVAYGAVQIMRWWGRVVLLSQCPEFRRVEN